MTNDDDKRIGENIKLLRKSRGMSQEKLGEALGVTFQQVQKYEKGTNRVAISTGLKICKALGVNITDITDITGTVETVPALQVLDKVADLEAKIKAAKDALA